ncbi:hypothetical protein BVRB_6g138680 [Beta vulgaris subsp. vulgaris]|nr:hypothetical protein BVRB_6g138680 [Beta vulgaris subsp. vulgaris]
MTQSSPSSVLMVAVSFANWRCCCCAWCCRLYCREVLLSPLSCGVAAHRDPS